jgi:hypothetical protein
LFLSIIVRGDEFVVCYLVPRRVFGELTPDAAPMPAVLAVAASGTEVEQNSAETELRQIGLHFFSGFELRPL